MVQRQLGQRPNGVLIANGQGTALAYSLFTLQERGRLCIGPGEEVYEGMIIGLNNRDDDLVVNPLKGKKLTNMRAAGKDENVVLTPPIRFSLEQAMEFIDDDELIEVTPTLDSPAQTSFEGNRPQTLRPGGRRPRGLTRTETPVTPYLRDRPNIYGLVPGCTVVKSSGRAGLCHAISPQPFASKPRLPRRL